MFSRLRSVCNIFEIAIVAVKNEKKILFFMTEYFKEYEIISAQVLALQEHPQPRISDFWLGLGHAVSSKSFQKPNTGGELFSL